MNEPVLKARSEKREGSQGRLLGLHPPAAVHHQRSRPSSRWRALRTSFISVPAFTSIGRWAENEPDVTWCVARRQHVQKGHVLCTAILRAAGRAGGARDVRGHAVQPSQRLPHVGIDTWRSRIPWIGHSLQLSPKVLAASRARRRPCRRAASQTDGVAGATPSGADSIR